MKWEYYRKHLKKAPKGKKKGDLTLLFHKPDVFKSLIKDLSKPFEKVKFDRVACLDALGFFLGSGVALKLNKGVFPIRKCGKLPILKSGLFSTSFVDYSGEKKSLEMDKTIY